MAEDELYAVLAASALFRDTGEGALSAASGCAERIGQRAGLALFKQGEPPDQLFLVLQGRVKMSLVTADGAQLTLHYMSPGEVIGCAAVFRRVPYPATATAVEDSVLLAWTAEQMMALVRHYPMLAANALAIVSGQACELLDRLSQATTEKVEQRLARALLRIAAEQGSACTGEMVAMTRQELAEIASTSLYTASRTVSAWSRRGIVGAGRGSVTIADRDRLATIAGILRDR